MIATRRITDDSQRIYEKSGMASVQLFCPACGCERMEIVDDWNYKCCDCGTVFKWGGKE